MKYSLADYGEVGGVGGTVVLKQDHASQHHVYEDQPAAAESWSLVLSLNNLVKKYTRYLYASLVIHNRRPLNIAVSHATF